jgi:hypothetical protein
MPVPTGPIYYPFAVVPSSSNQNVFPFDIVINEIFPGLIFDPTEAGSVYSVIREVNGCFWFVLNADWDATTLQWTQEDPTNPNLPAYAMELCATGTWQWYQANPTLIPGTPVAWAQLFVIDGKGYVNSTPLTVTASGLGQNQLTATWNAGSATQVEARRVVITDLSSGANSLLDNLVVNGTSKWAVDKTGLLVAGTVPASSVVNLFVNPTFTGTSTFTGPVVMDSTLDVFGATTLHSSLTADTTLDVIGHTDLSTVDVAGTAVFHGIIERFGGAPVVGLSSPDSSITVVQTGQNYTVELPATNVGFTSVQGSTTNAGTTENYLLPGVVSQDWKATVNIIVELTAPLNAGTLTITGTGSAQPGAWDSFSYTVTNPGQTIIPMSLAGPANGGDNLVMTLTISGGTISRFNSTFVAARGS